VRKLGTSAFGDRFEDYARFSETLGHLRLVTTATKHASPPIPTSQVSQGDREEYNNLRQSIETGIIRPTIRTESTVMWIGVAFFVSIVIAGTLAATVGASTYSTVVAFAVGTGGAAAYLQSFHSDLAVYFRTRRTLLNIESAWDIEGIGDPAEVSELATQMSAFLTKVTQMPSAYAGAS
jgi:hypothetical protein